MELLKEFEGTNSLADVDSEDFFARDTIDESLLINAQFNKFGKHNF
jgi:hypothetical protein